MTQTEGAFSLSDVTQFKQAGNAFSPLFGLLSRRAEPASWKHYAVTTESSSYRTKGYSDQEKMKSTKKKKTALVQLV